MIDYVKEAIEGGNRLRNYLLEMDKRRRWIYRRIYKKGR